MDIEASRFCMQTNGSVLSVSALLARRRVFQKKFCVFICGHFSDAKPNTLMLTETYKIPSVHEYVQSQQM
jgi:hypothetical protein